MFDGFSEPKAGVNRDARARNAGGFKRLDPFTQKTRHFSHHILIRGRALHRLRRAQHMHHAYPAVAGAHRVKRAGLAKSLTSLIKSAPASSAARMTSGLYVSTERGMPRLRSTRTAGITRPISSGADTGIAPGRVDSPPISIKSAPSSTMRCARMHAASSVG